MGLCGLGKVARVATIERLSYGWGGIGLQTHGRLLRRIGRRAAVLLPNGLRGSVFQTG